MCCCIRSGGGLYCRKSGKELLLHECHAVGGAARTFFDSETLPASAGGRRPDWRASSRFSRDLLGDGRRGRTPGQRRERAGFTRRPGLDPSLRLPRTPGAGTGDARTLQSRLRSRRDWRTGAALSGGRAFLRPRRSSAADDDALGTAFEFSGIRRRRTATAAERPV